MKDSQINEVVSEDICLVPVEHGDTQRTKKIRIWLVILEMLNILHWPILVGGTAVAIYGIINHTDLLTVAVLTIYLILWLMKILGTSHRRKFGLVTGPNGEELDGAIVQLTADSNGVSQHILSTITDSKGRFILLARAGVYDLTVAKEGFEPSHRSITAEETDLNVRLNHTATRVIA